MDDTRADVVHRHWRRLEPEIKRHAALIWEEPELPGMEFKSSALLSDWLEREGFAVQRPTCGIPTAFSAQWAAGDGPCIVVLAEYDALPGTDNAPVAFRERRGNRAGHACGHNHIGAANVGAAIAARDALLELGAGGKLVVLGCPAEEIVWGKVALLDRGGFDGADAILTSHADERNGVASQPCMSVIGGEVIFTGVSRHGGSPSSANALDAAELAIQSIERLRAHHFPDTNVEHVIRAGGQIPNVTPDETRLWITTRHPEHERAREVYRFVIGACEQASMLTGTTFREQLIAGSRGYLPNHALARAVYANLERVGPPRWTDEDVEWLRQLARVCQPNGAFHLHRDLDFYEGGCDFYGQDDGEASWRIPLARINWAVPLEIPFHNWALTALSGHRSGHAGALMASEALALAAVDLYLAPDVLIEALDELHERVGDKVPSRPEYGAFRTLTERPEQFWDATWVE